MSAWPVPIRVVGVGSAQGDDALAWEVLRELRRRLGSHVGVEIIAVEGGQRLLDLLDGRGTLVVIDALAPNQSPGKIQRFTWPDTRFEVMCPPSTHHLGPVEALELAAVIGLLPPRVVIFGMEGAPMNPQAGLSPEVALAVPRLAHRIMEELGLITRET